VSCIYFSDYVGISSTASTPLTATTAAARAVFVSGSTPVSSPSVDGSYKTESPSVPGSTESTSKPGSLYHFCLICRFAVIHFQRGPIFTALCNARYWDCMSSVRLSVHVRSYVNHVRWAYYISSGCKFLIVYMCQQLWKLADSRQNYCKNCQAYFFGPPCIHVEMVHVVFKYRPYR